MHNYWMINKKNIIGNVNENYQPKTFISFLSTQINTLPLLKLLIHTSDTKGTLGTLTSMLCILPHRIKGYAG